MKQPIRRLSKQGVEKFRELLGEKRAGQNPNFAGLRTDEAFSSPIDPECFLDKIPASHTRMDVGIYLQKALKPLADDPSIQNDVGLWSWLSLAWIDDLTDPQRGVGSDYRHIPELHVYRIYRHLLRTPYLLCKRFAGNENDALAALCNPVYAPGELNEQVASRQEFIGNKNLLKVATLLYVDMSTNRLKKGASAQSAGGVYRLGEYFKRMELTWDLGGMHPDAVLALLPQEFDRWKTAPAPGIKLSKTKGA